MTPLNGTKTHPLTPHATGVLRQLRAGPMPCHEINAGVINRFQRGDLAEIVDLPSPYVTHHGRNTPHMQITQIGVQYLDRLDQGESHAPR
jgi:hypothetical protein